MESKSFSPPCFQSLRVIVRTGLVPFGSGVGPNCDGREPRSQDNCSDDGLEPGAANEIRGVIRAAAAFVFRYQRILAERPR